MAPIDKTNKIKGSFRGKNFNNKFQHAGLPHNVKKKRRWIHENKGFDGNLKEGQGYAFKRKEKIKHQYHKLLRKERMKPQISKVQFEEQYPEHLRHLYLAEKERLDDEEEENKKKRSKGRGVDEEAESDDELNLDSGSSKPEEYTLNTKRPQAITSSSSNNPTQSERKSKAPFHQKRPKMSSYQKTKQEYERIKEERARKREEFLKDKAQREEALKKYKEKKQETYQYLKKKTKKGQPNLNLQMELLLLKIQAKPK